MVYSMFQEERAVENSQGFGFSCRTAELTALRNVTVQEHLTVELSTSLN